MTMVQADFSEQMRERFPEGLTGILAMGGTRVSYILENHRQRTTPGRLDNMSAYGADMLGRTQALIEAFFDLGTQHLIIPLLAFQLFEKSRGPEYAATTTQMVYELLNDDSIAFYERANIDPYFVGIDTMLRFPEREAQYQLAAACARFQEQWPYREGRHKLIWEVAPIPLYSIWRAGEVMGEAATAHLEAELAAAPSMQAMHDTLYRYYARAVYGTDLPMPHFYIGNNRNGDLKLRAMLPISLMCGSPTRFYFTPYPTMFMTRATIHAILSDLAFGKRLRSATLDYKDQMTPEFVQMEFERVLRLSDDPASTVGMVRGE